MPRRRPRNVDCAGDSTVSDVAVVMVALFGHASGKERTILVLRCFGFGSSQIACRRPNLH
jgi:hypothetical protein